MRVADAVDIAQQRPGVRRATGARGAPAARAGDGCSPAGSASPALSALAARGTSQRSRGAGRRSTTTSRRRTWRRSAVATWSFRLRPVCTLAPTSPAISVRRRSIAVWTSSSLSRNDEGSRRELGSDRRRGRRGARSTSPSLETMPTRASPSTWAIVPAGRLSDLSVTAQARLEGHHLLGGPRCPSARTTRSRAGIRARSGCPLASAPRSGQAEPVDPEDNPPRPRGGTCRQRRRWPGRSHRSPTGLRRRDRRVYPPPAKSATGRRRSHTAASSRRTRDGASRSGENHMPVVDKVGEAWLQPELLVRDVAARASGSRDPGGAAISASAPGAS